MPYCSDQKLSLQKRATDSSYTSFCHQGNGFLMIQMPQEHRFLPKELQILCKAVRFFHPCYIPHLIFDVQYLTISIRTSPSQQQVLIDPPDSAKQGTNKASFCDSTDLCRPLYW